MLLNVGLDHRRRPQVVRRVGSRHHPVAEAERITGPESAIKNTLLKRIATQNDASQSQTSVQNLCQNASDHAQIKTGSSHDSNLTSRFKVRAFSPCSPSPQSVFGQRENFKLFLLYSQMSVEAIPPSALIPPVPTANSSSSVVPGTSGPPVVSGGSGVQDVSAAAAVSPR